MASDNPQAAGGSSRRPRTPPTLDLKADEVRTESTPAESTPDTAPVSAAGDTPAEAGVSGPAAAGAPGTGDGAGSDPSTGGSASVTVAEPPSSESVATDAPAAESVAAEAPASEPPAAPAPRRGGSGAGTVIAALVLGAAAGGAAGGGVLYYVTQHQAPPPVVDIAPLTARIAVLETRPVADPAALAVLRQGLSQADARFSALDSALAALKASAASASSAAAGAPAPNVDALKASLAKTEAALAKTEAAVADVNARVAALKTAQDAVQSAVGAAAATATATAQQAQVLGPRLDALTSHVEGVRKEATEAASAASAINRTAAAVLVLGTLKQAVDSGRPFAAELAAANALLGPRMTPFDSFASAAQAGFPPLPKLADRLASAGNAAIDGLTPTPEAPAPDATLMTRFFASAQSLVKVRPADSEDPESLRGIVSRAVAATRAGDLDSALATLKQLPAPVQEKLAAVVGELDARRRAGEAAATLYQQALAAVSGRAP